nr:TPA: gp60-like protein [Oryctes rhinoceros nudivirus]
MSISVQSYESIVNLAAKFYDPNIALYFVNEHVDLTCDIILLLLQRKTIKLVRTMTMLLEPIVENSGMIFISIPLLAMLINEPVELPKNTVEFVDDFDIFKGLKHGVENTEPKSSLLSCMNNNNDELAEFTPEQRIRFMHVIRIVFMCSHFYQHYVGKTPYTVHKKPLNHLERAVRIKSDEVTATPSINYTLLSNM